MLYEILKKLEPGASLICSTNLHVGDSRRRVSLAVSCLSMKNACGQCVSVTLIAAVGVAGERDLCAWEAQFSLQRSESYTKYSFVISLANKGENLCSEEPIVHLLPQAA